MRINRNILWTRIFAAKLAGLGVKYACISPGSRSTPLVISFAGCKSIKPFVNVDERSSGFFALGLAKKSRSPVAIITTSGTAVAELYPAVIEAYQQRIPLIICTADRPPELRDTGANQTINQDNIYRNHIRAFFDAGLPGINEEDFRKITQIAEDAFRISTNDDKGPVHINFPFIEPFESFNFTDDIDDKIINKYSSIGTNLKSTKKDYDLKPVCTGDVAEKIISSGKGIIFLGPDSYDDEFINLIVKLSERTNFPVLTDGSGNSRFGKHSSHNIITNHTAFFRSRKFTQNFDPELIMQFGSAPVSSIMLKIFELTKAYKIQINEFGDLKDPSRTVKKIIRLSPSDFLKSLIFELENNKIKSESSAWIDSFKRAETAAYKHKQKLIDEAEFPSEARIAVELFETMPGNSNVMISNSVPVRDVDSFVSSPDKKLNIFTNRGASGIDGIISTAAGIAAQSADPTYLLIGDLAFYHDLNGMLALKKFKIPLKIILINNNGGGIFEFLPVKKEKLYFKNYFKTPIDLNFQKIITAYGGNHRRIKNWTGFKKWINNSSNERNFSVCEIVTDSVKSLKIRKRYWDKVTSTIDGMIDASKI